MIRYKNRYKNKDVLIFCGFWKIFTFQFRRFQSFCHHLLNRCLIFKTLNLDLELFFLSNLMSNFKKLNTNEQFKIMEVKMTALVCFPHCNIQHIDYTHTA